MLKRKKPEPGPTLDETLEMLRRSGAVSDELAQSDVKRDEPRDESTAPKVTDPHPAA